MAVSNQTKTKERIIRGQEEDFDAFFTKIWNTELEYDKKYPTKEGMWNLERILREIDLLIDLYNGMKLEKAYNSFHMTAVKTFIVNLNNQVSAFLYANSAKEEEKRQLNDAIKNLKKAEESLAKRMGVEEDQQ